MGKLNAVLSCLIVLLAIAAGVCSFLLLERRNEFRGRSELMAEAITAVTAKLDEGSATTVSANVTFEPGDPAIKKPETGTLSWQAYHAAKGLDLSYSAYKTTLKQVTALANDIHAQRNELAEKLAQISVIAGYPEDRAVPMDLQNLNDDALQDEALAKIAEHADKVASRDQAMTDALVALGETLGMPLDRERFITRETSISETDAVVLGGYNISGPLDELGNSTEAWNTRSKSLGEALADAVDQIPKHDWSARGPAIQDVRSYQNALAALRNDFNQINEKLVLLEKTQHDLKQTQNKLEEDTAELDSKQRAFAQLETDLMKEQIEVKRLEKLIVILEGKDKDGKLNASGIARHDVLEGKVLQVNDRWSFIVLNLGRDDVKDGTQMLVARGDEFVAKVEVSKVMDSISVAEILPGAALSKIEAGDRVILPRQD